MVTLYATIAQVEPVHYLPIATTILSVAFVAALLSRASKRKWPPHLVWWAVGVFFYGVGTAVESTITLSGNTETLNRVWYWAGAILGAYPLGTGSVYLLLSRRLANILTAITLPVVVVTSVLVFLAPMRLELLEAHRPMGRGIFEWEWLPWLTPIINLYAAAFLIGGAVWSSVRFLVWRYWPARALGTGLIAVGAILPGIGGAMTKMGMVEALYVGEFAGLVLIVIGYWVCLRAVAPPVPAGKPVAPVTA
jgi:hypothetical protein